LTATLACAVLGASVMVSEMVAATQITTKIAAPLVAPVVGLLDAAMVAAMVVGAVAAPLALETTGTRTSVIVAGLATLAAASAAPTLPRRRALATTCRRNQPPVGATP